MIPAMTVEEAREVLRRYPDLVPAASRSAAAAVRDGTCTCCPGDGDVALICGHRLCERCHELGHACVACALAS